MTLLHWFILSQAVMLCLLVAILNVPKHKETPKNGRETKA